MPWWAATSSSLALAPLTQLTRRSLSAGPSIRSPDGAPDLFRRERGLEVPDAERSEGVDHGVVHGGDRPDRARFAHPLGAELVGERRSLHRSELERWQLGRRDHG